MDRYKESERLLKVAVSQQCKENGGLIKQDFALIGRTNTGNIAPTADAGNYIRRCFSYRGATEGDALRRTCLVLIDTLSYLEKKKEKPASKSEHSDANASSFYHLAKLLKNRKVEEASGNVNICHLANHSVALATSDTVKSCILERFNDGFYELSVVKNQQFYEKLRRSTASDEVRGAIETYTKGTKNKYVTQGITILSEDGALKKEETEEAEQAKDELVPKNLNIQQLLGVFGNPQLQTLMATFEPYFECDEPKSSLDATNLMSTYVGGLHPPLHTYYTNKGNKRTNEVFSITSKNCLRRVHCDRKPQFIDHLLENTKEPAKAGSPFALLAKGTQGDHEKQDMILINETILRSTKSRDGTPVEYIAFIGKDSIKTFRCQTYGAHIYANTESQQTKMCSSLYESEVEEARLKYRIMLKMMRYELAWRSVASQWRSQNDVIMKAISNIEWGCMWQDWNFFTGGLSTEIDAQNVLQRLKLFRDQDVNESARMLREVCEEFIDQLNVTKRNDPPESNEVSTVLPDIVNGYREKVLSVFEQCYSSIRNQIYAELKPLQSRGFPPALQNYAGVNNVDDTKKAQITENSKVEYMDQEEVSQMRLELLPQHNKDALELSGLTNIDDILGPRLIEHNNFSGQPFLELLKTGMKDEMKVKTFSISSTAIDLCKKCADSYKSSSFTLPKEKTARALAVLNALVISLRSSDKMYASSKALQESFGQAFRIPSDLATWIITQFYERSGTGDFMLNVKGYQKLICYVMWLCIYLSGSSNSYNFATLRNVDLKGKHKVHAMFDKCVPIAGLTTNASSKSYVYSIALPLGGIPKTTTSSFKGLVGAIAGYNKRQRR